MRKFVFIIVIFLVVWFGYTMGRVLGVGDALDAERDLRTDFPLPPPPPDDDEIDVTMQDIESASRIVIEVPITNADVKDSFIVSGRAHSSLRTVTVIISDEEGEVVHEERLNVNKGSGGEYGRFDTEVILGDETGALDVAIYEGLGANKDSVVSRAVQVVKDEMVTVKVYFANSAYDEESEDAEDFVDICTVVHAVEREVSTNTNIYRAVLEELLAGPTQDEKRAGYTTSLPRNIDVKSVAADAEGTVRADFSWELDRGVAGSCRVQAIRTQIEKTLKQFLEVREVIIMKEGDTEELLQP